ncbi:MAG: site-2 protease family protein [Christensenellales bacterium]
MKFSFSPLFILLVVFYALTGQLYMLIGYVISIFMHELAHERIAGWRGYKTLSVRLMPYGGVMESKECYQGKDNIVISLAGPIFNFCIALCVVAAWWLVPSCYVYTRDICVANVTMGVINLLPLYPLDGSNVVIALSKNKLRSIRYVRIATLVFGALLFVAGIISLFYTPNLSIAVMGIFLFFGALGKSEKEAADWTSTSTFIFKNYRHGLRKTTVLISWDAPLFRCVAMMNNKEYITFEIVNDDSDTIATLSEDAIRQICQDKPADTTLKECLRENMFFSID